MMGPRQMGRLKTCDPIARGEHAPMASDSSTTVTFFFISNAATTDSSRGPAQNGEASATTGAPFLFVSPARR